MSAATHLGATALGEFTARLKTVRAAHPDRVFAGAIPLPNGEYRCPVCIAPIFQDEQGAWAHGPRSVA